MSFEKQIGGVKVAFEKGANLGITILDTKKFMHVQLTDQEAVELIH